MAHSCSPSTPEVGAGGSGTDPWQHSEFQAGLSDMRKKTNKPKCQQQDLRNNSKIAEVDQGEESRGKRPRGPGASRTCGNVAEGEPDLAREDDKVLRSECSGPGSHPEAAQSVTEKGSPHPQSWSPVLLAI